MSLAPPAISASGWLRALERSAAEAATGRLPASASRLWDREAGCRQSVGNGPTRGRPLHMLHPGCGRRISASSGGPVCSFFNHSFIHLLKCSCFTLLCQFLRYCTVNQPRVCVCVCVRACVRARVPLFGSPAHSLHQSAEWRPQRVLTHCRVYACVCQPQSPRSAPTCLSPVFLLS